MKVFDTDVREFVRPSYRYYLRPEAVKKRSYRRLKKWAFLWGGTLAASIAVVVGTLVDLRVIAAFGLAWYCMVVAGNIIDLFRGVMLVSRFKYDHREICEKVLAGETAKQISSETGMHPGSVHKVIKKYGLPYHHRQGGYRRIDRGVVERLYLDGLSGKEIAEKIGCARHTVYYILSEMDYGYYRKHGY